MQAATKTDKPSPSLIFEALRGSMKGALPFVRDREDRLVRYEHLKSSGNIDYSEKLKNLSGLVKKPLYEH